MRHTGIRAVVFISVLLLLPVLNACDDKTPAPAQTESPSYVIDSAVVKAADVPLSFSLNGRVVAYARADVRPQADGLIKERLFTEGSWVEQGQSLYQIDDALYQAQYAYAKANLAKARDEAAQAKREFERYQG